MTTPPQVQPAGSNTLRLRILSALVLAPLAVAVAWFGSPWLPLLTAVAGAVMAWEWALLCHAGRLGASGVVLIATVLAAIAGAAVGSLMPAIAVSLGGAALVWLTARHEAGGDSFWLALGALWVALPCVLLLWLARYEGAGRSTVLWIFAVVWATDIGAYMAGRWLGGPRLAPRWSPRKTWAGLIGGIVCAALAGWGTAGALGISPMLPLVLVSAGLAIVEQFGDLAESVAKRRFGVKDSSGLIPGHGGLLDRLDGLLAVIPAVALLTLFGGGSVLTWQ
ncbi:MAG TPA: phosphatidate cytidylyltransferase [Stellaceae bacterium]|nr:phosphatidate cytidylyltransferase [Stellaceae bacterium]